ncbi:MAG: hypothetical protein KDC44_15320, partial [Phaeodactylibacter sp.]|nr:hypothetical protein [Phaeodactylibacter sp.]
LETLKTLKNAREAQVEQRLVEDGFIPAGKLESGDYEYVNLGTSDGLQWEELIKHTENLGLICQTSDSLHYSALVAQLESELKYLGTFDQNQLFGKIEDETYEDSGIDVHLYADKTKNLQAWLFCRKKETGYRRYDMYVVGLFVYE